ncbi:hypothetical protein [Paraburkholderia sp. Ac-20340]|uniref:hypothetical protein n=1 Tax=Paraburkholderia sp. Ac-20340 TaxID=2703888 RepID=UPI003217B053
MKNPMRFSVARAGALALTVAFATGLPARSAVAQLSPNDDLRSPQNNLALMSNAPLGSEYPTHGNRQAGELPVGPTDPRGQLANGLPNNAQSGGYGAPQAGIHSTPGM